MQQSGAFKSYVIHIITTDSLSIYHVNYVFYKVIFPLKCSEAEVEENGNT